MIRLKFPWEKLQLYICIASAAVVTVVCILTGIGLFFSALWVSFAIVSFYLIGQCAKYYLIAKVFPPAPDIDYEMIDADEMTDIDEDMDVFEENDDTDDLTLESDYDDEADDTDLDTDTDDDDVDIDDEDTEDDMDEDDALTATGA